MEESPDLVIRIRMILCTIVYPVLHVPHPIPLYPMSIYPWALILTLGSLHGKLASVSTVRTLSRSRTPLKDSKPHVLLCEVYCL